MGSDLKLAKSDLVVHPNYPEWGPGKVVHIDRGLLFVLFRDVPGSEARKFKPGLLERAPVQSDPILDNLPPVRMDGGRPVLPDDRWTVEHARRLFLGHYPGGFSDPGYLGTSTSGERVYKMEAHARLSEFLESKRHEMSSGKGAGADSARDLCRVLGHASNLPAVNELIAFREGLSHGPAAARYFRTLFDLLDSGPEEVAFAAHAHAVASLPVKGATDTDKWTLATICPFLARPDAFMFVKPSTTKAAASALGFDIHYEARPNWRTYRAVIRMSNVYYALLADLSPSDFIDVQSFFWVTSAGFTGPRDKVSQPSA